jgi:hypothetical protein
LDHSNVGKLREKMKMVIKLNSFFGESELLTIFAGVMTALAKASAAAAGCGPAKRDKLRWLAHHAGREGGPFRMKK